MFYWHIVLWLTSAIVWVLIELSSPGLFFFLAFSLGSLWGALAAATGVPLSMQIAAFTLGCFVSFFLLRRFASQHTVSSHRTNVDALAGKKGIVTVALDSTSAGRVKLNGETWSARALEEKKIDVGVVVEVVRVKGVHLIVRPVLSQ